MDFNELIKIIMTCNDKIISNILKDLLTHIFKTECNRSFYTKILQVFIINKRIIYFDINNENIFIRFSNENYSKPLKDFLKEKKIDILVFEKIIFNYV